MALKVLLSILSLAPLAFFMGVPFPFVMRLGKERFAESSAAMLFAINGAASGEPAAADGLSGFGREAFAFAKIILFVGLFLLLGPFPAAFLFTFAYFSLSRHYHWAKALVNTTIFIVIVYLLFVEVLEIQLYHGLLEPLVNSY